MMKPRAQRSRRGDLSLPVGIIAVIVVLAIGLIAYRANSGLPLQKRYEVTVLVPDADRLIKAAEVRIGGVLVGNVLEVKAERVGNGARPYARIRLGLNNTVDRLPVDTTVQVRPASVLGLTYVDLQLGHSRQMVAPNGSLRLSRARRSSDLTDLLQVFDRRSARGFQSAIGDVAYGLAGRGSDLNATIASLATLAPTARRVAATLAAKDTRLSSFLSAYASFTAGLAPVSEQLGALVSNGATTLRSVAGVRAALGRAIEAAPAAELATTTAFRRVRPALDGLAELAVDLRPAGEHLPRTLDGINSTLDAGVPALRGMPPFARSVRTAVVRLRTLVRDPNTRNSLRKLLDLVRPTNDLLSTFVPAQVTCNVLGLWSQNFGATFAAQGDGDGPDLPSIVLSGAGGLGEELQNAKPSPNVGINPLPNENESECESNNEPWSGKQQLNNPPGKQSATTRSTSPPPGVMARAAAAGLLDPIPGAP